MAKSSVYLSERQLERMRAGGWRLSEVVAAGLDALEAGSRVEVVDAPAGGRTVRIGYSKERQVRGRPL